MENLQDIYPFICKDRPIEQMTMRFTAKPNRSLFLADDGGQTPALWRNLDQCALFIFDDYFAKSFLFCSSIQDTCAYPEGGGSGVRTPTPSNVKGLDLSRPS